jgi:hypothetical protein
MGSVVYIDSFDHYTTVADKLWSGSGGFGITGARNGNGLYVQGNWQAGFDGSVVRDFAAAFSEGIFGFALRSSRLANENIYLQEASGATTHIHASWDGSGHLVFKLGVGGTTLGTTTSVWTTNADKYVEIHVKIHDTTGFLRVYVNGALEINFSGDTRNGGSGNLIRFAMSSTQITFEGGHNLIIDDLYVISNDDGVSAPLGDSKVECRFPNGNGNSSQFDGSDGNTTDNYLLVDETPPNSDTDYVESPDVGDKDTYLVQDLAAPTGVVHAVQVNLFAKKSDAGARSMVSVARLAGTEADSASAALTTTYAYYRDVRLAKPGSGGWTISDFNSTEFGMKVSA